MKTAILDIETDNIDIEIANIKFIGLYDIENNKYEIIKYDKSNTEKIQKLLKSYNFIITFNGEKYDIPILQKHGISTLNWKSIDLYNAFKKRATLLRSGGYKSYSLDNISKEIGLMENKKHIDYKIFQKNNWTKEEIEEITIYLKQDLKVTNELWKFLNNKFGVFKEFISEKDANNYKHITSSTGALAYKVITNLLNIPEEYDDIETSDEYEGAYIKEPTKETIKGKILYFDFASLYPMMYIHANLFSSKCGCCKQEEKWHGNDDFKVQGYYCKKRQGRIENLIKTLYLKRKEFKIKKDNREFAIKIILNSLYGISAKPSFKQLYNINVASDCTGLSRQCIAYAINKLESNGYETIYADTDSCFVALNTTQNRNDCINLSKEISKEISLSFPFPFIEFNFKLENDLKYLQFFKGNDGELNKKNYLYIDKDNKLEIKGLDVIKKNCSDLSCFIFKEFLKEEIIKNLNCKFDKSYIDKLVNETIEKNKLILAKQFNIKDFDRYKSRTSIFYLIKEKYGEGELKLIKNYKCGAGKGIKYCSIEEAKDLDISDFNLEDVYKELSPFIKDYEKEKEVNPLKVCKPKLLKIKEEKIQEIKLKQRSLF